MSAANPFVGGMFDQPAGGGFGTGQPVNGASGFQQPTDVSAAGQYSGAFSFSSAREQQYLHRLQQTRDGHRERTTRIRRGKRVEIRRASDAAMLPMTLQDSQCRQSNVRVRPTNQPASKLTDDEKLKLLEEKAGHIFNNRNLARAAMNIEELSDEHRNRPLRKGMGTSCQNLAIIGDRVLELALLDKWFEVASTPATWEILKQLLTTNRALENFCNDARLYECASTLSNNTWRRATLVEALLGAVYLDSHKSLAAVQTTMEWLGLLQFGMKILEEAEVLRATGAITAGDPSLMAREIAVRMKTRGDANSDRVVIEISDDEDDNDNVQDGDHGDDAAMIHSTVEGQRVLRSTRVVPRATSV